MTATEEMKEFFEASLDDHPDDWVARLVFADWLEERGDEDVARCQRWMAMHQKRPGRITSWLWGWYDSSRYRSPDTPLDPDDLPGDVWKGLSRDAIDTSTDSYWKFYPSRRAAEAALAVVLKSLKESGS